MRSLSHLLLVWIGLLALVGGVRYLAPVVEVSEAQLVDPSGRTFLAPPAGLVGTATGVGFLLLGAWLTGVIFQRIHLPRISGYLLFGVLAGPNLVTVLPLDLPAPVSSDQLSYLSLVNGLAISFIALTAGGEIRIDFLRRGFKQITMITVLEIAFVFIGVAAVLFFARPVLNLFPDESTRTVLVICLLVGMLAVANSPAIVIAMIGETGAKGPMAQTALTVTILKDLILIIMFTIVVALSIVMLGAESGNAEGDSNGLIGYLSWHLIGSMGIGIVVGAVLTTVVQRIGEHAPIFVLSSALGLALMSEAMGLEPLLVSLSAGFTMANLWPQRSSRFFHGIEQLALPVYCVFFAVAGARIDVSAVLEYWPLAVAIVGVRLVMIFSGTWVAAVAAGMAPPARNWLWTALIPQAGVTIALIASLDRSMAEFDWITTMTSLMLATVALHELIGPVLMRLGLVRCGEASQ